MGKQLGRFGLIFAVMGIIFFGFTRISSGQSSCTVDGLLEGTNFVELDRLIPSCGSVANQALEQVTAALEGGELTPIVEARYKILQALLYTKVGNDYEARVGMQQAIVEARNSGDRQLEAWALYFTGRIFYNNNQINEANTWWGQAEGVARRINDNLTLGRISMYRGLLALEREQNENAMAILEDTLPFLFAVPDISVPEQNRTLSALSQVHRIFENFVASNLYRDQASVLNSNPDLYASLTENAAGSAECDITELENTTNYLATERVLAGCAAELSALQAELDTDLDTASDASERGRLLTVLGLVYSAQNDWYNAVQTHSSALLAFRDAGDREMEAMTLFYMGRGSLQRRQYDTALTYLNQSISMLEAVNDLLTAGRARLLIGNDQLTRQENSGVAANTLVTALNNLQTAPDESIPERIETLRLLNQAYAVVRDSERALYYDNLYRELSGAGGNATQAYDYAPSGPCPLSDVFNEFDMIYVERMYVRCASVLPQLMLTAQARYFTTSDERIKGIMQTYIGLTYMRRGDYLRAHLELDRAITHLQAIGDQRLLALGYYYLSLSYLENRQESQGRTYLQTSRNTAQGINDTFSLGRADWQFGLLELAARNYRVAANLLEQAYANLEVSAIPTLLERRDIANRLVFIYREEVLLREEQQRWTDILASLNDTNSRPAATPTAVPDTDVAEGGTSGAPTGGACDAEVLVANTDLVAVERQLRTCSNLTNILQRVQVARSQAGSDLEIAFFENYLGIVQFRLDRLYDAFLNHSNALNIYRNLNDAPNLARTYYYYGRTALKRNPNNEAINFLRQARTNATQVGDSRTVADVYLVFGNYDYDQGKVRDAVENYEAARENYATVSAGADEVEITLVLAQIYDSWSEWELAQDYYARVIELAQNVGMPDEQALAELGVARFHKYYGRFDEAITHAEIAIETAVNPAALVLSRAERADIARAGEDYQTALDILDTIDETRFSCEVADALRIVRGNYLVATGRGSQASAVFRAITQTECATRSPIVRANAYAGLADAELIRGESGQILLDAINASRRENAALNFPDPNYPRGDIYARLQETEYFRRLRNYRQTDILLGDVNRIATATRDDRARVDSTMIRVTISIDRGQYQNALDLLQEASAIYNTIGYFAGLASTVEQTVGIYLDQARYNDAINLIEFARNEYSSLPISFDSRVTYYEGRLYEQQGQYEIALATYGLARNGFEQTQEILSILDVDLRTVEVLHRRSLFAEAAAIIADVRETAIEQENTYYTAQAELALGDNFVLSALADPRLESNFGPAQQAYERSIAAYVTVGNEAGQANANLRLGDLQLARAERDLRAEPASPYLNTALTLYRRLENSFGEADALNSLGRYFSLSRDYSNALNFFNQALSAINDNDPFRRADIMTSIGVAYEFRFKITNNRSDLINSIDAYREATELVSFVYAEIADSGAQRLFATQDRSLLPYNRLIRIYALNAIEREGREADAIIALRYAEQSRARSYISQLGGQDIQVADDEQNSVVLEWQALREEVINLNRTLSEVTARAGDAAETDNIRTSIAEKIQQIQALESQIELPALQQILTVNVADLDSIRAALPDDTAMVVYYVIPGRVTPVETEANRVMAWVITRDSLVLNPIRVDGYDEVVDRINIVLQNRLQVAAQPIYNALIQPIRANIEGYQNLIIVPHAELNYVPFEMLWSGSKWLVDDFNISYVPSATVYTLLNSTVSNAEQGDRTIALAYSGAGYQGLATLLYVGYEVETISTITPDSTTFIETEATESSLSDLENVGVIHIAAHGIFRSDDPLSSYLALSPNSADDSDGRLTVREIYNLELQSHPLVTLSACDLARNTVSRGDELEGMTRAFLLTGARGVIASFWPVDDFAATQFMQYFYENRAAGMTNVEALNTAKRSMAADPNYSNPTFWAGFILVGLPN